MKLVCSVCAHEKKNQFQSAQIFIYTNIHVYWSNIFCDSTCTSNININELIIQCKYMLTCSWIMAFISWHKENTQTSFGLVNDHFNYFCQDGNCQKRRNQEEVMLKHWWIKNRLWWVKHLISYLLLQQNIQLKLCSLKHSYIHSVQSKMGCWEEEEIKPTFEQLHL